MQSNSCHHNNKHNAKTKFKSQKHKSMLQCHVLPSENPCWLIFGVSSPEISGLRLHHHEASFNHKLAIITTNTTSNQIHKPERKHNSVLQGHVLPSENPCWLIFGVSSPEISGLRLHHHEASCNQSLAITTETQCQTKFKSQKHSTIPCCNAMSCLAIRKSMLANFWSIFTRDQRITTTPS